MSIRNDKKLIAKMKRCGKTIRRKDFSMSFHDVENYMRFHADESWKPFKAKHVNSKNGIYLDTLNEYDTGEFKTAMESRFHSDSVIKRFNFYHSYGRYRDNELPIYWKVCSKHPIELVHKAIGFELDQDADLDIDENAEWCRTQQQWELYNDHIFQTNEDLERLKAAGDEYDSRDYWDWIDDVLVKWTEIWEWPTWDQE